LDGRVHQYRILPDSSGQLSVQVGKMFFSCHFKLERRRIVLWLF